MEEKRVLGGLYINDSEAFHKGILDGMSRTLKANKHDSACIERTIVSSRGRNPDNPSDRTTGSPTEQRLEPNSQGICNTLTSVSKDNYLMERKILTPKRTEYGKRIRKDYESGKIQESRYNMTELFPRNDGISNTITTVQKDNVLLKSVIAQLPHGFNKVGYLKICPTITGSSFQENNFVVNIYRIRKLTPRETWRLMDFSDKDFEKASEVNSKTQLYKQAGNSIVRSVLMAIFSQLNIQGIKPWNERTVEEIENMLKERDTD